MKIYTLGEFAIRNDTGEKVRIAEVRPNGLRVFYVIEHRDGHTAVADNSNLRPMSSSQGGKHV